MCMRGYAHIYVSKKYACMYGQKKSTRVRTRMPAKKNKMSAYMYASKQANKQKIRMCSVHVCEQAAFVPQQGRVVDADGASDRRVGSGTTHPGTGGFGLGVSVRVRVRVNATDG